MVDVAIAEQICDAIAVTPKSLEAICKANPAFPHHETFRRWLHNSDEIRGMYARAKASQCQILADQIIEIADDSARDVIKTDDGDVVDREVIERARIRIDSRKWLASKLAPRIFGDKLAHTGADGEGPVIIRVVSDI